MSTKRMASEDERLVKSIEAHAEEIVAEARQAVARSHLLHYERAGEEEVGRRLSALLQLVARSIREQELGAMRRYAENLATERFHAAVDLGEVQTAINALEEVLWSRILRETPAEDLARALGLVSTVLGATKDTLARSYVSLASHTKAPSLDLQSLFRGTGG